MKEYFDILAACPLFANFDSAMLASFLSESIAKIKSYDKNALLLQSGDVPQAIGIVLAGHVQIRQTDYEGNCVLIRQILPGGLFGEAFACTQRPLTVSVTAAADCRILWIDSLTGSDIALRRSDTAFRFMSNLLGLLAEKNIFFTERIRHLSKRSLSEKVLSYLYQQSVLHHSPSFTIPLNRRELADYLAADRSALSAVLAKLQRKGVLSFHKNRFTLLRADSENPF